MLLPVLDDKAEDVYHNAQYEAKRTVDIEGTTACAMLFRRLWEELCDNLAEPFAFGNADCEPTGDRISDALARNFDADDEPSYDVEEAGCGRLGCNGGAA